MLFDSCEVSGRKTVSSNRYPVARLVRLDTEYRVEFHRWLQRPGDDAGYIPVATIRWRYPGCQVFVCLWWNVRKFVLGSSVATAMRRSVDGLVVTGQQWDVRSLATVTGRRTGQ